MPNYTAIGIAIVLAVVAVALISCGHQPPGEDLWRMV
jgi:hypothetical protein